MRVKNLKCTMALIMTMLYCFGLSVPVINPFTFPTNPVRAQEESCTSNSSQGCLLVSKTVIGSAPNGFLIQVFDPSGSIVRSQRIVDGGTLAFGPLDPGRYSITESPASTAIFSGDCEDRFVTISASDTQRCSITNTVEGLAAGAQGGEPVQSSNPNIAKEQVSGGSFTAEAGLASGAGQTLGIINPPFDVCKGNFLRTVAATADTPAQFFNEPGTGVPLTDNVDANALIRAPTSATYTAGGTIALNEVLNALDKFNTDIVTIQLYSDFQDSQPVALADSAPQFKGAIMVEDSEGLKHEVINFNLNTIRTECKFITIAKPAGDPPNKNVYPLGVIGENDETSLSSVNEILVQQRALLVTALQQGAPPVLNPPFATCDVPRVRASGSTPDFSEDDFGIYNVRGKIDQLGSLHGDDLNVEINVDLVIHKRDLAKITDNNNPYIKVNLIVDEDENSAHKVPFTIHDLWTDCKDLSLNNDPLFTPIQSEIIP